MSDANQLYSLLQVGTSRAAGLRPAMLPPELEALVPDGTGTPEARLWLALAGWSLWRRAGYQAAPAATDAHPPAAAGEQLRTCPPGAEALLARLLQGGAQPALLREWLRGLARFGGHLPARFLPNLLALGTRHAELRPDVAPVLGERGHWLARRDPGWAWAAPTDGEDGPAGSWDTGGIEQRTAALSAWRATDPAAARDALAEAWPSEAPDARARLLACLSIGLAGGDEAFLESALDDRRKEVRVAAQAVLAQLPESALRRRMRARAEPLLQLKRPLLGRTSLEVALPDALDKAAARDGVGAAAHPGLGEKAGWLVDLLAAVDPRVWCERLQVSPADLVALAARSDFAHALLRGWSSAVLRGVAPPQALAEWTHALLACWMAADDKLRGQFPRDFFDVFARMAPAELHAWLAEAVGASRRSWGQSDLLLLHVLRQAAQRAGATWPAPLSRALVERLLPLLPAIPGAQWETRPTLDSFAGVVDPQAVAALEPAWRAAAPENAIHGHIANFFDTVRLRHEVSLSFQEPA